MTRLPEHPARRLWPETDGSQAREDPEARVDLNVPVCKPGSPTLSKEMFFPACTPVSMVTGDPLGRYQPWTEAATSRVWEGKGVPRGPGRGSGTSRRLPKPISETRSPGSGVGTGKGSCVVLRDKSRCGSQQAQTPRGMDTAPSALVVGSWGGSVSAVMRTRVLRGGGARTVEADGAGVKAWWRGERTGLFPEDDGRPRPLSHS